MLRSISPARDGRGSADLAALEGSILQELLKENRSADA
jgi:hypothetical protein